MEPGPLLCVAAGLADHVKAAALMRALAARPELPSTKLARVHNNDALDLARALFAGLDVARDLINLGIADDREVDRRGELLEVFEFVVDHVLPRAVIVFDGSEVALACGTVAQRKHVPVIHIGAGLRTTGDGSDPRKAIDELADLLYTTDAQASETLAAEGMPPEKVHCVGNLLMDAMQVAVRASPAPTSPRSVPSVIESLATDRSGYGLVMLSEPANVGDRQTLLELLTMLRDASRDLPLAWPMQRPTQAQLKKYRLSHFIDGERIASFPPLPYPDYVALLRGATCVLTDSWDVQEEATALGIPCLTIGQYPERAITVSIGSNQMVGKSRASITRAVWECIFNGGKRGRVPELWDGKTGTRIANFLSAWLPSALEEERQRPQF
jgi:UDP-N-acetylglucosamine 2-epimerase (non-hydrolysing)